MKIRLVVKRGLGKGNEKHLATVIKMRKKRRGVEQINVVGIDSL